MRRQIRLLITIFFKAKLVKDFIDNFMGNKVFFNKERST